MASDSDAYKSDQLEDEEEFEEEESNAGWIQWFCSLDGHEFFAEVDSEFIEKASNLYNLKSRIPRYELALDMIQSSSHPDEDELQEEKFLEVYQDATDLYGLIHYRYIYTPRGLAVMREKFLSGAFGVCPRVVCERQNVLPIAIRDELKNSRVKVYCPRCKDVYIPKYKLSDVDGAYFGTSFPHVLMYTYPDLKPRSEEVKKFVPKIFGFALYKENGSKFEEGVQEKQVDSRS